MATNAVLKGLVKVQSQLKAPKDSYNNFGKYAYRSAESILSVARPLCNREGMAILLNDEIVEVGNWKYVKATASVVHSETGEAYSATAFAREAPEKKGMDSSQVTGSTSSYARKYALCGLFAIDGEKDADTQPPPEPATDKELEDARKRVLAFKEARGITNEEMKRLLQDSYGKSFKELNITELSELEAVMG